MYIYIFESKLLVWSACIKTYASDAPYHIVCRHSYIRTDPYVYIYMLCIYKYITLSYVRRSTRFHSSSNLARTVGQFVHQDEAPMVARQENHCPALLPYANPCILLCSVCVLAKPGMVIFVWWVFS